MVQIICDRCKREIKDDEEIWCVSIFKENSERNIEANKFSKWQFCNECKNEIENFTEFKPKEKKKIQKVNHEAIMELKNKGFARKEIAEELGIGINTVNNSLQRYKEKTKEETKKQKMKKGEIEEKVMSMFLSGKKTDEVAQKLGIEKEKVTGIIAKM